jgi:predicted 3-demethylubiquinone-9 3-methyltransferase (glyoxalase superfamily)
MRKITPFLWYDNNAEEAVNFYTSVFSKAPGADKKKTKIGSVARYDEAGAAAAGQPKGSVMTASFKLNEQEFVAINGGPHFKFTEAISFVVNCKTQKEVDYFWEKLSEGGQESMCGWLKDKFGLSWQIVPRVLFEMLGDKNPVKAQKAMQAMLQMKKIIIKDLEKAYNS